jgi:predicted phage tail protein
METTTESTSLISADLLKQVNELLSGARIEKIESDDQLTASVNLLKQVKRTAADLESERTGRVKPLNDRVKEINDEYKSKGTALSGLAGNLSNKGAEYQHEQQRKADEARLKAEREAEAERRRLADMESKRLEEEERLRNEAIVKQAAADAATNETEKAALREEANTAAAVADIAMAEAVEAAQAVELVEVAPVVVTTIKPSGFKPSYKYSAKISNFRAAMTWIVTAGEWSHIENEAFKKIVQSAIDKVAAYQKDAFVVPGCSLVKDAQIRGKF